MLPLDQLPRPVCYSLPSSPLPGGTRCMSAQSCPQTTFLGGSILLLCLGSYQACRPCADPQSMFVLIYWPAVPRAVSRVPRHWSGAHENKHGDIITSQEQQSEVCETLLCKNVLLTTGLHGEAQTAVQAQYFSSSLLGRMRNKLLFFFLILLFAGAEVQVSPFEVQ